MEGKYIHHYPELEPEKQTDSQAERKRSNCRTIIVAVLTGALVTAGMLAVYDKYFAQKIVALDVKGYIAEQRDLYLSGKINDAQLKESFDRLEKAKERVPGNRIIILGDVLVRKNVEEIKP